MTKRIIFISLLCLIMAGQIVAHELTPSEALSFAMEQIHAGKTLQPSRMPMWTLVQPSSTTSKVAELPR